MKNSLDDLVSSLLKQYFTDERGVEFISDRRPNTNSPCTNYRLSHFHTHSGENGQPLLPQESTSDFVWHRNVDVRAVRTSPLSPELLNALTRFSIDTIVLWAIIPPEKILGLEQYEVIPGKKSQRRTLWIDAQGKAVEGVKAVHRSTSDQGVKIALQSMKKNWTGQTGLAVTIQFSVQSLAGKGSNVWPVTKKEFECALYKVQQLVTDAGLEADIFDLRICRLDWNRNYITNEAFRVYADVYKLQTVAYMTEQKVYRNGRSGINHSKKINQLEFYDKKSQQASKRIDSAHLPDGLGRVERRMRFCRNNYLKKMKVRTLRDLMDGWDRWPVIFQEFLCEKVRFQATKNPRARNLSRCPIDNTIENLMAKLSELKIKAGLTEQDWRLLIDAQGLVGFQTKVKSLRALDRQFVKRKIDQMRAALQKVAGKNPDFARRSAELEAVITAPLTYREEILEFLILGEVKTVKEPARFASERTIPFLKEGARYQTQHWLVYAAANRAE